LRTILYEKLAQRYPSFSQQEEEPTAACATCRGEAPPRAPNSRAGRSGLRLHPAA
jgi:hypothetical protein